MLSQIIQTVNLFNNFIVYNNFFFDVIFLF